MLQPPNTPIFDGYDEVNTIIGLAQYDRHNLNAIALDQEIKARDQINLHRGGKIVGRDPKTGFWWIQTKGGGRILAEAHTPTQYVGADVRLSPGKIASFDTLPPINAAPTPRIYSLNDEPVDQQII